MIDFDLVGKVPRVSIGMPVYNGEKFLKESIDSLLAQTFEDFELIISDNASTDKTETICRHFVEKDSRIKYFRQVKNAGPPANFDFVLSKSSADYFMWAACDDWWSPNWIEELLKIKKPDVAIAFGCSSMRVNPDLSPDGEMKCVSYDSKSRVLRRIKYFMHSENGNGNFFYGLMNRRFLESQKTLDAGNRYLCNTFGPDFIVLFILLNYGKIVSTPKAVLLKRNSLDGVRRHKHGKFSLALMFLFEGFKVFEGPRLRYLRWYFNLGEGVGEKILIGSLIPVKIVASFIEGYSSGFHRGLSIAKGLLSK